MEPICALYLGWNARIRWVVKLYQGLLAMLACSRSVEMIRRVSYATPGGSSANFDEAPFLSRFQERDGLVWETESLATYDIGLAITGIVLPDCQQHHGAAP